MLTQSSTNQSVVYLSISNGKLVRRVDESTPNAIARVNKVGKQVYELFYNSMIGHIVDISTKENEYGKFIIVKVKAHDTTYNLEMNYSSGYSVSFLRALPNVDISQNVEITPKLIVEGDKKKSVIFLNQGGKAIKHFFTKENPNGMPDLEKIKVKGKDTWDDTKRMEFLENYAKTKVFVEEAPF